MAAYFLCYFLQIRKAADKRANVVDAKLAEMAAAMQRQLESQVVELQAIVERNCKKSAEEMGQALDRVRNEILDALATKQAEGANKPIYLNVLCCITYLSEGEVL